MFISCFQYMYSDYMHTEASLPSIPLCNDTAPIFLNSYFFFFLNLDNLLHAVLEVWEENHLPRPLVSRLATKKTKTQHTNLSKK